MEGNSINDSAIEGTVVARVEQSRADLPPYDAHQFEVNFPKWQDMISSGKKTADAIIALVGTKGALTDAQKNAIRDCEKKPEEFDVPGDDFVPPHEQEGAQ